MHTCSDSIVSLTPLVIVELVMRDYSCRLWVRLGGQLYVVALTDSAASVQPPWVVTANFGVFAIEVIETSSRVAMSRKAKLMIDMICLLCISKLLQRTGKEECCTQNRVQEVLLKYTTVQRFGECLDVLGVSCIAPFMTAAYQVAGSSSPHHPHWTGSRRQDSTPHLDLDFLTFYVLVFDEKLFATHRYIVFQNCIASIDGHGYMVSTARLYHHPQTSTALNYGTPHGRPRQFWYLGNCIIQCNLASIWCRLHVGVVQTPLASSRSHGSFHTTSNNRRILLTFLF
jgi:hypothetical protein